MRNRHSVLGILGAIVLFAWGSSYAAQPGKCPLSPPPPTCTTYCGSGSGSCIFTISQIPPSGPTGPGTAVVTAADGATPYTGSTICVQLNASVSFQTDSVKFPLSQFLVSFGLGNPFQSGAIVITGGTVAGVTPSGPHTAQNANTCSVYTVVHQNLNSPSGIAILDPKIIIGGTSLGGQSAAKKSSK